jgi:hypothetical protein
MFSLRKKMKLIRSIKCDGFGKFPAISALGSHGSFNEEEERARRDTLRKKSLFFSAYLCAPSLPLR